MSRAAQPHATAATCACRTSRQAHVAAVASGFFVPLLPLICAAPAATHNKDYRPHCNTRKDSPAPHPTTPVGGKPPVSPPPFPLHSAFMATPIVLTNFPLRLAFLATPIVFAIIFFLKIYKGRFAALRYIAAATVCPVGAMHFFSASALSFVESALSRKKSASCMPPVAACSYYVLPAAAPLPSNWSRRLAAAVLRSLVACRVFPYHFACFIVSYPIGLLGIMLLEVSHVLKLKSCAIAIVYIYRSWAIKFVEGVDCVVSHDTDISSLVSFLYCF